MLASGLAEVVAGAEDLARFLTQSSQFGAGIVKAAAFLPGKDDETSVFRHGPEPATELWRIGSEVVAVERRVRGVAFLKAGEVRDNGLEVEADEPPPRHAAIRQWPVAPDLELQKAARKERALDLARCARLVLAE